MAEAGSLVVQRPKGGWRDFARSYVLEVDGEPRGKIRRGQTLELQIPAGRRAVRARIDWTGSPEVVVEVRPGTCVTCVVEPAGNAWQARIQIVGDDSYLRLSVTS